MTTFKVQQFSGTTPKTFKSYIKASAQFILWRNEAWKQYNAGNPAYRETVIESNGVFVRPKESMFAKMWEVAPEKPVKAEEKVPLALQRGKKPPKPAKVKASIAAGEPFGHPYVPTPDEVNYPDAVLTKF